MKTTLLSLKAFFTICLLCLVGGVNVMADTYTYTFKKNDLTTTTPKDYTFNSVKWNVSGNLYQATYTNNKGILITKKDNQTNLTFSTSDIPGTITSVTVKGCTGGKNPITISVKVGDSDWGSQNFVNTTVSPCTFNNNGVGKISVNIQNTQAGKSYYLNSLEIEYTTGNVISAPTITPTTQEFSKPFTATISPVEGAKIYYTIDGSDPTTSTTRLEYTTGVEIPAATTTLKAVAIKDGTASKVAEAVYTYEPPTYAYTIWSENWDKFTEDAVPTEGTNATYLCNPSSSSGTRVLTNIPSGAGGTGNELIIKKNSEEGSLTINVTSLKGYSGTLYFSFLTNKDKFTITSTTTGVNIGEPTIKGDNKYTYAIIVPEGTEGLNLKITNTAERDNMRVDDLSLSAKFLILGSDNFTLTTAQYGTYYTEDAFVMPEGVTGYTITSEDGKTLNFNETYAAGAVVPAKTALVLKATEELTTNKEYTYTIVNSTAVAPTDNLLHGSVAEAMTNVEGAKAYYKLANPTEGRLGFYYGAENGGAFKNGAHKAYLAVKTETLSQMRGFSFDSMTTGINHVVANAEHAKTTVIYDLNGRRVNSLNAAAKGVYIVNGKKVIVK